MWAGLLTLALCLRLYLGNEVAWVGRRLGSAMSPQLVTAVYRKVLRLPAAYVCEASCGRVVNLMTADARRVDAGMQLWTYAWAGPMLTAAVLVLVSLQLNVVSAIAGLSVYCLVIPLSSGLAKAAARARREAVQHTDERLRLAGEMADGAMAVKMLGREDYFRSRVRAARASEARLVGWTNLVRGMQMVLEFSMMPLACLATFAVHGARSGSLDLATVYYVIALLALPKWGLCSMFHQAVQALAELGVALGRIDAFLQAPEEGEADAGCGPGGRASASSRSSDELPGQACPLPAGTVALFGGTYRWADATNEVSIKDPPGANGALAETQHSSTPPAALPQPPALSGVHFSACPGQLVGVWGPTGAGKSSLLAALLGELRPVPAAGAEERATEQGEGRVKTTSATPGVPLNTSRLLVGRVAYCAQEPWIVAGSIRDNILLGRPYDEVWYGKVLAACCLEDDVARLVGGDLAQLGERGANLSGGQRARIALARACYARPSMALLDDPLSAVDPRVSRDLFDRALGPRGLLAELGATRVLVTHQSRLLPRCDRVLVLSGGQAAAWGAWADVAPATPQLAKLWEELGQTVVETEATETETVDWTEGDTDAEGASGPRRCRTHHATHVLSELDSDLHRPEQSIDIVSSLDGGAETPQSDNPSTEQRPINSRSRTSTGLMLPATSLDSPLASACGLHSPSPSTEHQLASPQDSAAHSATQLTPGPAELRRRETCGSGAMARLRLVSSRTFRAFYNGGASYRVRDSMYRDEVRSTYGGPLAEERSSGAVSWAVYGAYCRTLGLPVLLLVGLLVLGFHGASLAMAWWLGQWARAGEEGQREPRWMLVYGSVTGALVILVTAACALFFLAATRAATAIHNRMLEGVLRAPLSFFHANPTGRILNRFSKDQGRLDDLLPYCFFDACQLGVAVLAAAAIMTVALPVILAAAVPLAVGIYAIRSRYVAGSVEVERLEGVTRSPLAAALATSIRGLATIRAFAAADVFAARFEALLTTNTAWFFVKIGIKRWLSFRLDALSTATAAAAIVLSMAMREGVDTAILALALTSIIGIVDNLQWLTRQTCEVEAHMASLQRILSYAGIQEETDLADADPALPETAKGTSAAATPPSPAALSIPAKRGAPTAAPVPSPPQGWPRTGALCYEDVTAEYRPDLPPCLVGLSFRLEAGSSCGVVGRTGSGKSSLMLTLFRLIRVTQGTIRLDGADIARVPLAELRRQLAVIPQDPLLFSGTLRSNLDPSGALPDSRLWEVLRAVQLREAVGALPGGLGAAIAHGGGNLSVGQRQLFCLARALLQDAKVLALDEATANVDHETDELIQRAVHSYVEDGSNRVLIMIAHRIDTVMSADQLLVLCSGELVESGPPAVLQGSGGVFSRMVRAARHGGED